MKLRNYYFHSVNGNTKRTFRSAYLSALCIGLLLFGMPVAALAIFPPTFPGGSTAAITVCSSSSGNDITAGLAVDDADVGETLTWSESGTPANGTLSGFPYSDATTGTVVTPIGLTYTPSPGYEGTDMFMVDVTDGSTTITVTVNVTVLAAPSIALGGDPQVCLGATSTSIAFVTTTSYSFTGSPNTYVVPAGVTSLDFDIMGGAGGNDTSAATAPGNGGRLQGTLAVTPGDVVTLTLGGAGNTGTMTGAAGGFNGGGASSGYGGSGGGATDIRLNGTTTSFRVAVAGGGGGSGHDGIMATLGGGAGGGLIGADGTMNADLSMATGGNTTSLAGGLGATFTGFAQGMDGGIWFGGAGSVDGVSGGGGGGFYGGGGGAWSGGAGGSSYADGALVTGAVHTQGYNAGSGQAYISFDVPGSYTYSITWDAGATTAGFTDVAATAFPTGSAFPITIPSTATPDTYTGTITVSDGTCTYDHSFSVTVKPIPDVTATSDETVCNGAATSTVSFSGSLTGTTFDWTNDNTSIGLAATGTGNITSFAGTNSSVNPVTANVVVTPKLNGCSGPTDTFSITVNPTPTLNSDTTLGYICDNDLFSYSATGTVSGTSFAWSRPSIGGIAGAGSSGTVSISENLDNTTINPIAVTYTYTMTANACTNSQFVTVTVNPTPTLFPTPLVGTICDGDVFSYTQNSLTPGVTYSWSRAAVTGISNPDTSDVGNINETLFNTTTDPITVDYIDTLNINGCKVTDTVSVVVNPTPMLSTTLTPASICNNDTLDYGAASLTSGTVISWERFAVAGITSPYASGADTIHEGHTNTTDTQMTVVYNFTLSANGCTNNQQVSVVVNPTPSLNTTVTPAAICDSSFFDYDPGSNTPGVTFAWSRAAVTNITNPAASGTNNPNERLRNAASFPVVVTYVFTTTIDGCSNSENVVVTVNPRPRLTNTAPTPICDSTIFAFTPASATLGFTTTWTRPYVSGIDMIADTGSGAINEVLDNTTYTNVTVAYIYTLSANGCTNEQTVNVLVHPTPELLPTAMSDSACSEVPFVYNPDTKTNPPVKYMWSRAAVAGISPNTAADSGAINETLSNSTTGTIDVMYVYTLTVGAACTNVQTVNVAVRPSAAAPVISVMPPASLCQGTLFQNFGADSDPAAGVTYKWSATNAEVYATGTNHRNCLVNFNNTGTAVVMLTATIGATGCIGTAEYTVDVNASTAPTPSVVYTKGRFVCLRNDVKNYQWGYDDANTLDSVMLKGETGQGYFNASPDFNNRKYWVIVNAGDCMRKVYYNKPDDNTPRVIDDINGSITELKVFPNPAEYTVNVKLNTTATGNVRVELLNMLGQVLRSTDAEDYRATFNVASLPTGVYLVDCYIDGVKVGATRFVKK